MKMNIKEELSRNWSGLCDGMCGVDVQPQQIHTIFINETVPSEEMDDFYGDQTGAYASSVQYLFADTPFAGRTPLELLQEGIYFTNVMKNPKQKALIGKEELRPYAEVLQEEVSCFPACKCLMLMGDAAIQAYTMINRKQGKKRVIPAGSTYKLRKQRYWDEAMQVFPSYIMTGKNLLIEKSKITMIKEDIFNALFS